MRRKCAGIPIAAKITPTVRPAVVRGTGAPKPVKFTNLLNIKESKHDTIFRMKRFVCNYLKSYIHDARNRSEISNEELNNIDQLAELFKY